MAWNYEVLFELFECFFESLCRNRRATDPNLFKVWSRFNDFSNELLVPSSLLAFRAQSYFKLEVCEAMFYAMVLHVFEEVKGYRSISVGEWDVENQFELFFNFESWLASSLIDTFVSHTLLTGTQVIQSEVCDQIDKPKPCYHGEWR